MISVLSKKIPMVKDASAIQIIENDILSEQEQTNIIVEESLKQIDFNLEMQVFNGPRDEPLDVMTIKTIRQLGTGGSATVNQVRLSNITGDFVDKTNRIYNNIDLAVIKTN